jgi:hypothetical protein
MDLSRLLIFELDVQKPSSVLELIFTQPSPMNSSHCTTFKVCHHYSTSVFLSQEAKKGGNSEQAGIPIATAAGRRTSGLR